MEWTKDAEIKKLREEYDQRIVEAFDAMDNIEKYREYIVQEQKRLRQINLTCQIIDESINLARRKVIERKL